MISCSFSSVWVLFSSASHSLLYHCFPESLSSEFLSVYNFSHCYTTRVFLFCLPAPLAPRLPSGKGRTWERNDSGLPASDETIPQVTL